MSDPARDVLCVSSTQVGKTFALAAWLLGRSWEGARGHPWWWLAPTYSQTTQGFRLMMQLAQSAGILRRQVMTPFPRLVWINGAEIEFRSWEREQNLMGTSIAGAVVDEAGLLGNAAQAAISTRRSSTLGPVRYIGNPGLVAGPFRRLCALAEHDETGTYSAHRWTWEDKLRALQLEDPRKAQAYERFMAQERLSLPEFEFRRLYEAVWTEDEAAVFRLGDCYRPGDSELLGPDDDSFVLGVDVGQVVDYLAAVSIGVQTRRVELRYHRRGIGYPQAAVELQGLQKSLHNAPIVLEVNGPGIALRQEFDRLGVNYVPFTTTNQSKQELVMHFAADTQQSRVQIADHPPLPHELSMFRYERTASGVYRYSAPPGEHDDTVMAALLAEHGVRNAVTDLGGWI